METNKNAVCPVCGGRWEENAGSDGIQCDTCGLVRHSDGSHDCSEMCEEEQELLKDMTPADQKKNNFQTAVNGCPFFVIIP